MLLGDPDYNVVRVLNDEIMKGMSTVELLNSYIAVDVEFKFTSNCKYPSIPCYLDDAVNIYPLSGRSTITGLDYLLAKRQGCDIKVISGYQVGFKHFSLRSLHNYLEKICKKP